MEYLQQHFSISYEYRVCFTRHLFDPANGTFADFLEQHAGRHYRKKLLFIVDSGVVQHHPALLDEIRHYCTPLEAYELVPDIITAQGGEQAKNDEALLSRLIAAIDEY